MQKKLDYLPKSKKIPLLALSLVLIAAIAVAAVLIANKKSADKPENQTTSQSQLKTAEETKAELLENPHYYELPGGGIAPKRACEFFIPEQANELLGGQATKNDDYSLINHPDYDPSVCIYVAGNMRATVWLYYHPDESKAQSSLAELENESNLAASKGPYVVTAAVERNGNLDEQASNKLLQEITDQL